MSSNGSMFDDPTPCCAKLRCKSMYFRADERPGMLHHEEAMDYWCSDTNGNRGPDRKIRDAKWSQSWFLLEA